MRQPLSVFGYFDFIDEGTVTPIGDTGYYWVTDRTATGFLGVDWPDARDGFEGPNSDIIGEISMTYDAIVEKSTQGGFFWGSVSMYDEIEDITYTARFIARSEGEITEVKPDGTATMEIVIDGHLRFTENAEGRADLNGTIVVGLTGDGHIDAIVDSEININGRWSPHNEERWNPHVAGRWNDVREDHCVHRSEDPMHDDAMLV